MCRLSGLIPLALFLVIGQQFQNGLLNLCGAVAFREVFPQILHPEADFVLLVSFGFPEDLKDSVHGQFPGLAQFLHLNGLGQGWRTIFRFHSFQKIHLFLLGQIGQLRSGSQSDFTIVHFLQNFGNQFRQTDVPLNLPPTVTLRDFVPSPLLAKLARSGPGSRFLKEKAGDRFSGTSV